jgi:nucleotide-binding universal stress UspA family protein
MHVVAVIPEAAGARTCLQAAAAAATIDPSAQIEALHVKVDPRHLDGVSAEEIAIQYLREKHEGTADARSRAVREVFRSWQAEIPPELAARVHWCEVLGPEQRSVLHKARAADLLVIAPPHNLDGRDAMHAGVFCSQRPLLLPTGWSQAAEGTLLRHMAIAWYPVRQARRAVKGALPWLAHAARVSVVVVGGDEETMRLGEIEAMLATNGIAHERVMMARGAGKLGERILELVHGLGASSVVMGAYRHSAVIEWVLGKTTRQVLAKADVPLFMAH